MEEIKYHHQLGHLRNVTEILKKKKSTQWSRRRCDNMKRLAVVVDLFFVTPIVGLCNCSMFCCALLDVHSSFAII